VRKRIYNFEGVHTFIDGRVITNEQFISEPQVFSGAKNQGLCNAAARTFDPNYAKMEREQRRFERTEQRRQELAAQKAKINEELARL